MSTRPAVADHRRSNYAHATMTRRLQVLLDAAQIQVSDWSLTKDEIDQMYHPAGARPELSAHAAGSTPRHRGYAVFDEAGR
jgi:hypothetical protein